MSIPLQCVDRSREPGTKPARYRALMHTSTPKTLLLLVACAMLLLGACERPAKPPAQPRATGDFIRVKEAELQGLEDGLRRLRLGSEYQRVLDCVVKADLRLKGPQYPGPGELRDLQAVFDRDVATTIVMSNLKSPQGCDANFLRLIRHVGPSVKRGPSLQDGVLLSDVIVVARALGPLAPERRGDGLRSSIPFVAEQSIRGGIKVGRTIAVRSMSGPVGDGTYASVSGGPRLEEGGRYLILASRTRQRVQAALHGGPTAAEAHVPAVIPVGGVIRIDGDVAHAPWGPTSPAQLLGDVAATLERWPAVGIVATPATVQLPGSQHAASSRNARPHGPVQTAEESIAADAAEIARSSGRDPAYERRRLRISHGLAPFVSQLRADLKPQLAGIALLDSPDLHLQVRLKGAGAPRTEYRDAAGYRVPIRFLPGSPASIEDMLKVMERHHQKSPSPFPSSKGWEPTSAQASSCCT